jgi:hypothetical protein
LEKKKGKQFWKKNEKKEGKLEKIQKKKKTL